MIRKFIWTAVEKFGSQLINLIVQLVLARILAPEAFGLIGLIQIFIAIAQVLVEAGIGNFIIQRKDLSKDDIFTSLSINVVIAFITYIIIFLIAPFVGEFYEQPIVINLLRTYAIVFILQSTYIINQSFAIRNFDFRKVALISLSSSIVSALLSITIAIFYQSVYVLVFQQLIYQIFKSVLFFFKGAWSFKFYFNKISLKKIHSYSTSLLIIGVLNQVFNYAYLIVAGKMFSVKEAGFYSMSLMLIGYGVTSLSTIIERVSLPILSRLFHCSLSDYKKMLFNFSQLSILLLSSFSFLISIYSEELTMLFLGPKWHGASTVMFYVGLSFLMFPVSILSYTIFKTNGKTKIFLKCSIISKIFIIVSIVISFNSSLENLLLSQVIAQYISALMFIILACYSLKLSVFELINNHSKLLVFLTMFFSIQLIFKTYTSWFVIMKIVSAFFFTILLNSIFKIYDLKLLYKSLSLIQTNHFLEINNKNN